MNEELINKIITYNYNNFGNEFGDTLVDLQQENARLKDKIEKSIDKLEYYNSDEDLWYVPIQDIIDILKEN